MGDPETKPIRAAEVVPYEWALWCSVEGSQPFENEICAVRWSEDGQHLWFMLESHNFLKAHPDEVLNLVPYRSKWRTDEMQAKTRADHADIIAKRPLTCVACKRALPMPSQDEKP